MSRVIERGRGIGVRVESLTITQIAEESAKGNNIIWVSGSKNHDEESLFFVESQLTPLIDALIHIRKYLSDGTLPLEEKAVWPVVPKDREEVETKEAKLDEDSV